jgi:hypothetical protein
MQAKLEVITEPDNLLKFCYFILFYFLTNLNLFMIYLINLVISYIK